VTSLLQSQLPRARSTIVWVALPDGAVLFCPETEVYYGLDPVGASIWELLPENAHSLETLSMAVNARFPDGRLDDIRDDVSEFLTALEESGLVVREEATSAA
jgi:hypothetical protein